jgi:SAM-dependent methyltransferase
MASWDSHIPATVRPCQVVGLGLNENELRRNPTLSDRVIHDLNRDPRLPFEDGTFHAVICTVSVDYLTRPVEVFRDVGRVLKPGGLFLVVFSNRYFPSKVVRIWRESNDEERMLLVEDFFGEAGAFEETETVIDRGRPRPEGDRYGDTGIASDPVYAVYANRSGGTVRRPRPRLKPYEADRSQEEIEAAMRTVGETLSCPYCGGRLERWQVPQSPFTEWPNDFLYICFNDACSYFVRGWGTMADQGNPCSYRLMYDPLKDACHPMPVLTQGMLKDGILEEV